MEGCSPGENCGKSVGIGRPSDDDQAWLQILTQSLARQGLPYDTVDIMRYPSIVA